MDPVRDSRARWARIAELGNRVGYLALAVAVVVFLAAFVFGLSDTTTVIVISCLALATVTLAPAIVIGYAVKAAEREDRERGL